MLEKKDIDRGLVQSKDPSTDATVYMYVDDPGVYYMGDDEPVSAHMAKAAGFDIRRHAMERKIVLGAAVAEAEVAKVYGEAEEEVLEETEGFKLVRVGHDSYNVRGPSGGFLNPSPLPQPLAKSIFDAATAPEEDEEPVLDMRAAKAA